MKQFLSLRSNPLLRKTRPCLAAAAIATLALSGSAPVAPVHAQAGLILREVLDTQENAQIAALDQLLADFHGALSYGGNIDDMMALWVENPSATLNGETQITLHGDRAEATTQCVAVDISASPNVVKAVIQVSAVAVKRGNRWLLLSMSNTSPAPL
ncbi:MAG TPA: hypothetical protein VGR78_05375 [Verrucomicrobiae bacterium]|nr:hypothetical protein [Verrucomicrobiae bacterium]